jgi:hypothetical protein
MIANVIPIIEIGRMKNQLICLFNKLLAGIILKSLTKISFVKTIMKIANAIQELVFGLLKSPEKSIKVP